MNHKKLFRVQLDNTLHHIIMTEEKTRNYSIRFSLQNVQCPRVEYSVLWSFSHTCTLAQEQPVSDFNYICCCLSLAKGTGVLMSFPNLKQATKTEILPQMQQ